MIHGPLPSRPPEAPRRAFELTIDGNTVTVPEGSTILDACTAAGVETPTLCFLQTLTPVNACRVCVVELDGSRVLVPACARKAEDGMEVRTDSERVRHSRKMVLEFLGRRSISRRLPTRSATHAATAPIPAATVRTPRRSRSR